ncbi:Uu.00g042890.m01.CDS01 [Anthostomella pinea]|uniref:Uu.00g042890.m01.CDS01 n=1 Tax=Anthostomella pinea TaxID=933095 RepID=A0AAI8YE31_9PEZI|nr:Uu.00g042890.m01.CDS01 [Anthostomella pinea]
MVEWLDKFKECMDVAVSFDPVHAALPWAGAWFLIMAASASTHQTGLMFICLEAITRMIARGRVYEMLYIQPLLHGQAESQFEKSLVLLYKRILEVLSLVTRLQRLNTTTRTMHAVFHPFELSSQLQSLELFERDVEREAVQCEALYQRQSFQGLHEQYAKLHHQIDVGFAPQLEQMSSGVTEIQFSSFCDWLITTNPSSRYNEMLKLHQSDTNSWVLNMDAWKDWSNPASGSPTLLRIHGIPGAGKTIMAAYLINVIEKIVQESSSNDVSTYYFCYHIHQQDETSPFLRWVVTQLCRLSGYIPPKILQLNKHRLQPTTEDLLHAIEQLLGKWDSVYIIVEALDESQKPWTDLLEALRCLATESRFKGLRILGTSREYPEFEDSMRGYATSLPMNNENIKKDTERFVDQTIRRSPNRVFKKWPEDLVNEVETTLVDGARGMFQWVKCQLDLLRRYHTAEQVKNALKELPPDLHKTYERIFDLIPDEDKEFLQALLRWTLYPHSIKQYYDEHMLPPERITIRTLLEAALQSLGQGSFYDEEDIQEIFILGNLLQHKLYPTAERFIEMKGAHLFEERVQASELLAKSSIPKNEHSRAQMKVKEDTILCCLADVTSPMMSLGLRGLMMVQFDILCRLLDQRETLRFYIVAVLSRDTVAVQLLLEAGADPNAMGDPNAFDAVYMYPEPHYKEHRKWDGQLSPLRMCNLLCNDLEQFRLQRQTEDAIQSAENDTDTVRGESSIRGKWDKKLKTELEDVALEMSHRNIWDE